MKHKNIPVWSIILPFFFLFLSCRDEMAGNGNILKVEEGIPGTLTLSVTSGDPTLHVVTRASEEEEKYISSLYVFVLDVTTPDDPSAHPVLSRKWFPDTQGLSRNTSGNLQVSIPAVSCNSVRIFAVANLNTANQLSNNEEMLKAFHNAANEAELESITARLDVFKEAAGTETESGGILALVDRLQGSLLSAGHYCSSPDSSPYEAAERFVLDRDGATDRLIIKGSSGTVTNGAIRLHHLDARFNFVVKLADGLPSGAYFKLKSWKVKNLHMRSFVHWQEDSPCSSGTEELGRTTEMNGNYIDETFSADKETSSFTFYAFENRHMPDNPFNSAEAVKKAMQDEGLILDVSSGFTADQAYALREKKKGDGSFKYAPGNAAYVVLKGEYYNPAEKVLGGITQQCSATVTYLIHLGYIGEGNMEKSMPGSSSEQRELEKLNDYRILRNSNYTYTVTVGGVDNIRVEAEAGGVENQPAAEGNVVDSDFDFQADAHYEQRLVKLNLKSVVARMNQTGAGYSYTVNTPFTSGPVSVTLQDDGGSDRSIMLDDEWVHFAYLGNDIYGGLSETLHRRIEETGGYGLPYTYTYDLEPGESSVSNPVQLWGPVALLQHLKSWINIYNAELAKGKEIEGREEDPYIVLDGGSYFYLYRYFTVYVDEYYYTQDPVTGTTSNTFWMKFCNVADRTMSVFQGMDTSVDGHSSYTRSGMNIRQRSIQTLYSPGQSGQQLTNRAFGIEHTDEYGGNYNITPETPMLSASSTSADGLDNTCRGLWDNKTLVNKALGEFTWKGGNGIFPLDDRTSGGGMGWPMTRGSRYVNVVALSRNRDNNRNGLIDLDEIVWYVPAKEQMMHLYVGSFLMDDPLYQARLQKGDNLCYATSTFDVSKGLAILVASKGAAIDWMKDGSFSETDRKNCYIRCARNLGTPPIMQANAPYTGIGYAHEGLASVSPEAGSADVNYIITYNKLNTTTLRSYIGTGSLGSHTQFQAAARPYRSFVTAKQLLYGTGNSPVTWNEARSLCYNYSEQTDRSDKGNWRLPNSCEAMAMLFKFTDNLWDKAVGRVMWSCTQYNGSVSSVEYIGVEYNKQEIVCAPGMGAVGYARCVRDNPDE